jgi:thiosulfate/3-mercaptopyruvate sulfurtransferase
MRSFSRRVFLTSSAAGLIGIGPLRSFQHLAAATPEASPVASPVVTGSGLLIPATEAVSRKPAPLWLAVMDEGAHGSGHLDGDVRVGWDEMALTDGSNEGIAAWTDDMRDLFAVRGVSAERPVVVYDEGSLFAARGWWQLAYLGYPVPVVLDGGLAAWRDAGGEVVRGQPGISAVEMPPVDAGGVRPELLATKDDILGSLGDPDVLIVDARGADEYAAGHIPGAVNFQYTGNAIMKEANLYLPPGELRARYEDLGMNDGMRAITYCSTGARGSVASFAMRLAGFQDVALYAGSWNEWSSDPDAAIE